MAKSTTPTFSGTDAASRAWRKEQAELSNDISGLPRDRHFDAMMAAFDALDLSDEQRIMAMTVFFKSLAKSQPAPELAKEKTDSSTITR